MKALPWVPPTVTELPPRCTSCGHSPVTVCVDYLRRDQGLPQPTVRRWACGCGASGVLP